MSHSSYLHIVSYIQDRDKTKIVNLAKSYNKLLNFIQNFKLPKKKFFLLIIFCINKLN